MGEEPVLPFFRVPGNKAKPGHVDQTNTTDV